ncbi:hypothetical protein COOONC_28324 [Cooperia oncophora]
MQLADSYRGSAALRSAWFDALADLHTAENWHTEAAVCHAHSLAIIAKELASKGLCKIDWAAFEWISSSIVKDEGATEPPVSYKCKNAQLVIAHQHLALPKDG